MDIVVLFDSMRSLDVCGDDVRLCDLVGESKAVVGEGRRKRTRQECEIHE